MQEDHCEFQARLGYIGRPPLKTKTKPSIQMEKQIHVHSKRESVPHTGVEGQCPDSDLSVFGQNVTNVIADGVVDGVVVGAGSSAALQPISGQGAIPAAIPSQFL